jgi:hypothetical protein
MQKSHPIFEEDSTLNKDNDEEIATGTRIHRWALDGRTHCREEAQVHQVWGSMMVGDCFQGKRVHRKVLPSLNS